MLMMMMRNESTFRGRWEEEGQDDVKGRNDKGFFDKQRQLVPASSSDGIPTIVKNLASAVVVGKCHGSTRRSRNSKSSTTRRCRTKASLLLITPTVAYSMSNYDTEGNLAKRNFAILPRTSTCPVLKTAANGLVATSLTTLKQRLLCPICFLRSGRYECGNLLKERFLPTTPQRRVIQLGSGKLLEHTTRRRQSPFRTLLLPPSHCGGHSTYCILARPLH